MRYKHKTNGPIVFDWWLFNKPHRYYGPATLELFEPTARFWWIHGKRIKR